MLEIVFTMVLAYMWQILVVAKVGEQRRRIEHNVPPKQIG